MSGYDRHTGWCHFTPSKWHRYYKELPGEPDDIKDRCRGQNIAFYIDKHDGIHAQCGEGRLWTLLSGEPASWDSEPPESRAEQPEFLTATDLGVNLDPPLSPIKTNLSLAAVGLQERVQQDWIATDKGLALCTEVQSQSTRPGNKIYLKWSFNTIEILTQFLSNGGDLKEAETGRREVN